MRVAAVDCGTNSVRLLVRDLPGSELHREMRIVRLGEGVDKTGSLAPQAISRTQAALEDYAKTCSELGVERIRMVATSATRDASNRADFVAMVVAALGVEPEVISGDEEAGLSFRGATAALDLADGPFLVMDIGGGSTEFVLGTTEVEAARSVDIGCVRLTERHLVSDPPTAEQIAGATGDVDAAIRLALDVVPAQRARTAVGLAGSVTTVAALALELPAYQPERIHLCRIPSARVHEITAMLLGMTRAERAALPVMHPGRVDVIGGGALVLDRALTLLGMDEVLVSESDILDGIALSVAAMGEPSRGEGTSAP
jgi:exopolyphosphatase/guanosine-5'-triphosphate,3'-diphosphate pyrophosphatase